MEPLPSWNRMAVLQWMILIVLAGDRLLGGASSGGDDARRRVAGLWHALVTRVRRVLLLGSSTTDKTLKSTTASTTTTAPEHPAKFMGASRVEMTEILLPNQADPHGVASSGVLMSWIDICAGIAAKTHASLPCVTASVDAVHFLRPIHVGEVVVLKAAVNKSWRTSMEVGVRVESENMATGERRYCCHAYLTFVALRDGKPAVVPGAVPETPLEHAWNEAAEVRRSERIARKKRQSKEIKAKAAGVSVRDEEEYVHFDRQLQRRWSCEAGAVSLPRVVQERQQHGPWHGEHGGGVPSTHSYTRNVQLIMPQHANSLGVTFGGHIIRLMERCAVVSAARHTQKAAVATDVAPVTDDKTRNGTATAMTTPMAIATTSPNALVFRTASIDSLNFLMPTRVGDLITIRASVSRAFHSSLEVYVTVHASTMHTKAFADDPASSTVHHARTDPTRDCGPLTSEWTMTNDGYLTVVAFAEPSQSMHKRQESNDDGDDTWRRGTSVMPPQSPTIMQDTPHGQVPPVLPQTELEQWRYACAEERRERRLRERDELKEVYLST